MRDLTDVLGAAVEARALALDGLEPASGLAGLRTRVRRRRAVRHTVEVVAVLPLVAAIGVGGWLLLPDRDPVPPVVTPSPTSTPTDPTPDPTPTSTPTPTATREPVLGDPINESGVPTYFAMPDGVLDEVRPGWVLATYAPRAGYVLPLDPAASAPLVELVFLVSPEGTRYLISRLDAGAAADASGATWVEHELVSWDTGDTGAIVRELRHSLDARNVDTVENGPAQWLDLATGILTPLAGDAEPAPAGLGQLSPDGSMVIAPRAGAERVVERVSDGSPIAELPARGPAGWCEIVTWWAADSILAVCFDADPFAMDTWGKDASARPRLVILTVDELGSGAGTILRQIGLEGPVPYSHSGTYVADGVVAWEGTDKGSVECADGVYLQTGDRIERLPADGDGRAGVNAWVAQAVDGVVYVQAAEACATDPHPTILTAYDVATGTTTELVPSPPGDNPNELWRQGLSSYVVGR